LLIISIVLCIGYYDFSSSIDKYFYRLLIDEARRVKVTFVVFLASFTSRAVVNAVVQAFFDDYGNKD